jgi:single-stranded DNA-binding protein
MAGRSTSLANATFTGIRIIGNPTYTPAYVKPDGSTVQQKVEFAAMRNSHRGHDRNGGDGRKDPFRFVVWGKLADSCAKSLAPGKAIDVECEPQSYKGDVYVNRQPVVDNAGNHLQVTKVSFKIKEIAYGEDSAKLIADEIQRGQRPVNWDKKDHPDYQTWRNILHSRQQTQFDPQKQFFGWAEVRVPAGVQINLAAYQAPVTGGANVNGATSGGGGFGGGTMTGAVDQAYRMSNGGGFGGGQPADNGFNGQAANGGFSTGTGSGVTGTGFGGI